MNALKQVIKKLKTFDNFTPRIAFLLKLQFLEILTRKDENELHEWVKFSKANDRLFALALELFYKKTFTVKQRIKEVLPYARITSREVTLIKQLLLHETTDEEEKELDEWMHESEANDRLFDLVLDYNREKTLTDTFHLIERLLPEPTNSSLIIAGTAG